MRNLQRHLAIACSMVSAAAYADNCLMECPAGVNNGKTITRSVYTLKNNATTKFADWVAYHVTTKTISGPTRKRNWKTDPSLADGNTLEPSDYKNAYATIHTDRGHQVPLASFSNTPDWAQLNFLSNITPQSSALNQGPWNKLENAVRQYVKSGHDVYVVSGPLYESYFASLPNTDKTHTIPSGYFKVIAEKSGSTVKASAFIMEQTAGRYDDYCDTEVTVNEAEQRSGIDFMPGLSVIDEPETEGTLGGLIAELGCS
ncbi:Nuclease precursor [Vibrio aerogenes CECT 7868]|uniref:Endonuclease n=1 Tax=Vibrio aerogenes CECT 7868 TaxID=1216006 RepID=A0A1M5UYQ7_9VIBR|nr:DNA/RNA non-specific endonuclease [Vibrio aerogenes]SHH68187.1 Nuclease precursor [Vibrio aerogenes CECT 7868]